MEVWLGKLGAIMALNSARLEDLYVQVTGIQSHFTDCAYLGQTSHYGFEARESWSP